MRRFIRRWWPEVCFWIVTALVTMLLPVPWKGYVAVFFLGWTAGLLTVAYLAATRRFVRWA